MTDIMERPYVQTARWCVIIFYRTNGGLLDVEHVIEELFELQDIVEQGPDWNTIERIDVRLGLSLAKYILPNLTIEQAELL